ncbi:MAG TPA: 16S rRNA (cytidine(1402)-2'-O)-methyltransferase [Blastocatellia bacterium]|nr:16S rRNA (cytidine(1402)-2'-O)-methyltransferase [Blastocatellia bacterium]
MSGILYLVSTPIGNLEDITMRALGILRQVDLIACEDTRHTRKLLSHYQISKPLTALHEHNERARAAGLADKLEAGIDIALVCDAGTPTVSDPGYRLVREAVQRGIRVVSIPGPSALITALAASGLPTDQFTFAGFLPARRGARRARLAELATSRATLIFYEAPHRITQTITDALEVLGNRQCVIARELTKFHEEFLRGSLAEIEEAMKDAQVKGEIVLLIGPPLDDNLTRPVTASLLNEVEALMLEQGIDRKSALKRVARSRGITKSEAYRLMLAEQAKSDRE